MASDSLQQGDMLRDCAAPLPPTVVEKLVEDERVSISVQAEEGDVYDRVIVLTQSCDLEHAALQRIMLCPLYTFDEFSVTAVPGGGRDKLKTLKADLRRGRQVHYHLLDACDLVSHKFPHLVADFSNAFSVPADYATLLAEKGERVGLLPPYREHLAQDVRALLYANRPSRRRAAFPLRCRLIVKDSTGVFDERVEAVGIPQRVQSRVEGMPWARPADPTRRSTTAVARGRECPWPWVTV